jgi:hypothetical protein
MSGAEHAIILLNEGWAARSSRVQTPGVTKLDMRYRVLMLAAFLSGLVGLQGTSLAQPYRAREGVQSGQVRSLDQILNGIRRQRPGSLADVQGPNPSAAGGSRYRLKWVTPDGRVLWLDTDAQTGRVLGVEGEDRRGPPAPPQAFGRQQGPPPPPVYNAVPPGYGRPPPGYGPPPAPIVPQPQGYGPPRQGYGPPPGFYGQRGFGPGGVPPGLARVPPGRRREFGPGR